MDDLIAALREKIVWLEDSIRWNHSEALRLKSMIGDLQVDLFLKDKLERALRDVERRRPPWLRK